MVEDHCTWIGFGGYVFVFLFFIPGIYIGIKTMIEHFQFGLNHTWTFKYKDSKDTPLSNVIFFALMNILAIYFFIFKIGFTVLPSYWKCLMG